MVHAAKTTLVTVERIKDKNLLDNERTAAGTLPNMYVKAIALAKKGCWPLGLDGHYGPDNKAITSYMEFAKTELGFRKWLEINGVTK